MPHDLCVRGGRVSDLLRRDAGVVDEGEHPDVAQERERVQDEQDGERRRVVHLRDRAGHEATEPDPEVHRHALLSECGVPAGGGRQPGDQRRLARPEARAARALDRDQDERLPGLADEREQAEPERLEDEPRRERAPSADPVDQRAGEDPRDELGQGRHRDDEAGRPQREPADVVQVDDEEREHEPVSERVREAADLEQPDGQREARVQAAEVGAGHRPKHSTQRASFGRFTSTSAPADDEARPDQPAELELF